MRSRTLAGLLAAGLLAAAAAGQPPAQPPPPTPTPPPAKPGDGKPPPPPSWPKELGGKDLKGWLGELNSTDPALRDAAIKTIPLFGPEARASALKPLLSSLRSERDPGVRLNVIDLLGVIGARDQAEAKEIAKALGLALTNSSPGGPSRLHLVRALSNYGADAGDAVTAVLTAVTDPSWETRRAVAYALGRLAFDPNPKQGPDTRALKSLATSMIKDDAATVRLEAVQSLILLGPPAYDDKKLTYPAAIKPYLDPVVARQKVEKEKPVLIWLQVLVMRYDGSQLTDANISKGVAVYLTNTDPAARYNALTALGMLGDKAKPFVPQIAAGLSYEEQELVYTAIGTLAALAEHAKAALPELERFKSVTKEEGFKTAAQEAIDIISGKKKPMAPPPAAPPKTP